MSTLIDLWFSEIISDKEFALAIQNPRGWFATMLKSFKQ